MIYGWVFLCSFCLTVFLSPLIIRISYKLDILSNPKKGEGKGKPCLGGVGIYAAFIIAALSAYFLKLPYTAGFVGFIVSSSLIFLVGLVDDIKDLRPYQKIVPQLIAIGCLIAFGIFTKISFLPIWLNVLITVLWVLYITNAFNLLDIVDGLTSGLVIIISATLLVISLMDKDIFSSIILIALIGSHVGFLKYNYPPAKLYMGDTGSLFSGFLLAAVAINISYAPLERPVALMTPVLVMSLPIYDTIFLIIMRSKKRKSIFKKTNDHFALRLVTMGHGVHKSIWIMYLFSMFLAVSSLIVAFGPNIIGLIVLIIILAVFVSIGKKVGMVKIDD